MTLTRIITAAFTLVALIANPVRAQIANPLGAQNGGAPQAPATAGPQADASEILKQVREQYRYVRTWEVAFSVAQQVRRERDGLVYDSKAQMSAVVWAQAPDRLRVEARDAEYAVVKVVDGRIRWLYLPDVKIFARHEADANGQPTRPAQEDPRYEALADEAAGVTRRYATVGESQSGARQAAAVVGDETLEVGGVKVPCRIVELRRLRAQSESVRQLWIEKNRNLVWKEVSTQTSNNEQGARSRSNSTWSFTRIRLNEALADTLFTFVAPQDAGNVPALPRLDAAPIDASFEPAFGPAGPPAVVSGAAASSPAGASRLPELLAPQPGAVLENGGSNRNTPWEFRWSPCQNATRYHLQIKAAGATRPLVDVATLRMAAFREFLGERQFSDSNLKGWTWRVRCQAERQWSPWAESTFDVKPVVTTNLPAPKLVAPADQSVFNHYPRETVLVWRPVPGAAGYRVEIDYGSSGTWASEATPGGGQVVKTTETSHTHLFVGAQPGRWRVWAVDANGLPGAKSEWWEFVYTR